MKLPFTELSDHPPRPPAAVGVIAGMAGLGLAAHVLVSAYGPYGIHRDAYLYMAMGEHLRLWHMDFPPLIAIVSRVGRTLFGDSVTVLRLVPALAVAGLVVTAGLSARELGGRRFEQGLACLAVLASAVYLRAGSLFQPVALDQLWWTLGLYCLLRLSRTDDHRWWLAFGVVAGLGLLTKFSILIFGAGTLMGLLLSPARRWLATPWPWTAAGLALVVGSPSLVGQLTLGFPLLGQMGDLQSAQLARVSPASFLVDQPMMVPGVIFASFGVLALVGDERWRAYRLVGATGLAAFVIVLLMRGKSYYVVPIYPVLLGAGAVVFGGIRSAAWRAVARWGAGLSLVAYLIFLFPLGLPILPPAAMEEYQVLIGLEEKATATNVGGQERIPQDYADMLGWPELVAEVGRVYAALPPVDRERAVILASNYGEAGAIDFHGPAYDLPAARAFVGSYWFYGPGPLPGDVLVLVGFQEGDFAAYCGTVERAGRVDHPYAVAEQRDLTIHVCRDPVTTLQAFWPTVEGLN